MTPEQAILTAMQHAAAIAIRHAGVTRDHYVVITKECVEYQKEQGTLLYEMDGNWKAFSTKKHTGWKKGETIITTHLPENNKSNGKKHKSR